MFYIILHSIVFQSNFERHSLLTQFRKIILSLFYIFLLQSELLELTQVIKFFVFVVDARYVFDSELICRHIFKVMNRYTAIPEFNVAFIFTYVIIKFRGMLIR